MWFAYVDESFNRSQHWVAALLVQHTRVNETARALRDVVDHASAEFGIATTAELHGHDLFHGRGEFAPMKTVPRARIALYSSALRTLADADCWIILRSMSLFQFYLTAFFQQSVQHKPFIAELVGNHPLTRSFFKNVFDDARMPPGEQPVEVLDFFVKVIVFFRSDDYDRMRTEGADRTVHFENRAV